MMSSARRINIALAENPTWMSENLQILWGMSVIEKLEANTVAK
jgi:hypothetical protein